MPPSPDISYGDNVRVLRTAETERLGVAELIGNVYGETNPSESQVNVIGETTSDYALNVYFESLDKAYWLAPQLLEFVSHAPGTEVFVHGSAFKSVHQRDGTWKKVPLNPQQPTSRIRRWLADMHPELRAAFDAEMQSANRALAARDPGAAFAHLERAHVLGQWYVGSHTRAHIGMLRAGWQRRDLREIVGQLLRIPGGMIGSALGRVPRGNTGGANVSAFREMAIPPDVRSLLLLDRRSRLD